MAVTYAWRLDSNKFAYIVPPENLSGDEISNKYGYLSKQPLSGNSLKKVADTAQEYFGGDGGKADYLTAFGKMEKKIRKACSDDGYMQAGELIKWDSDLEYADLLSADMYYNVDAQNCADLRGVGIKGTMYLGSLPNPEDGGIEPTNVSYYASGASINNVTILPGLPGYTDIYGIYLTDQIENENSVIGINLFLFKDEIVLEAKAEEGENVRQTFTYSDFLAGYTGGELNEFNKTEFINYLTSDKMYNFYLSYETTAFISLLIANIMVALLDVLEIAILGSITATIARIRIKFSAIYTMATYSLTLPMILNILYIVINYFTDFTITYFQVAYIAIAYIYLAAAIFILKDDVIKKLQEVEKIKQEQLNVRKEIKEEQNN